jgi:hypothetical protein
MEALNVVKIFMWMAYNNALPTRVNLFERKIVTDPLCPICYLEEETMAMYYGVFQRQEMHEVRMVRSFKRVAGNMQRKLIGAQQLCTTVVHNYRHMK